MGACDLTIEHLVASGERVFASGAREGIAPPLALTVSEWADRYRKLSRKNSSEPGQWRTDRTPYLREPMDCLGPYSPVEEVVLMFGTQLGKTEMGNCWIGYTIHVDPAPMMVVQPTQKVAKRWTKQRFKPMRDEMPELRALIAEPRSRDAGNTADLKEFPGGILIIAGANSASDLRSTPVAKLYLDEIDNYPQDVDGEGDPVELAEARTTNFPRRKVLKTSSPTTRGFSRIEAAYLASDQCYYHVPCPHCGERQPLEWAGLRWEGVTWRESEPEQPAEAEGSGELERLDVDVARAWYVCRHCGAEIEEGEKTWMLERGLWVPRFPGRRGGRVRGFHLNSLYSPIGWKSWAFCAAFYLKAKRLAEAGDDSKLKVFTNTILAETYEERGARIDHALLAARAEAYALGTVPAGGLIVSASVDVQGNRLEACAEAWGEGEECWLVDYRIFWGDPGQGAVWDELDQWLRSPLKHASGADIPIRACAIDSGGHHTQQVYSFCRSRAARYVGGALQYVFAVKGASQPGKPILGRPADVDIDHRGQKIKRGAQLWPVGSDTAKGVIYSRLRIEMPGPGYQHFPREGLPPDYYEQLTAERLITRYHRGRPRLEWVLPAGCRNEALDLKVYSLAAAHRLGVPRLRPHEWARLRDSLMPKVRDLFDAQEAQPDPAVPDRAPISLSKSPRRGGFVKAW